MNKTTLSIIFALCSHVGFSQYDGKGEDEISRFRAGFMWYATGLRPAKSEKVRKYDRLIFDVTYNDWIGDRDLFKNHWASIGLNTNFMFDIPLTKGNKVAFGIGAVHQWVNIRHDGNLNRDLATSSTTFTEKSAGDVFNKSSYGSHTFGVPIELRFRNESWKHFKIHLGGKVGYKTRTYSKEVGVGTSDNFKYTNKTLDFYDPSRLEYSAHVRIGLRNWALYASYGINTIFTNENSTQLNRVQFGLSISLF
ncbi:MAG: hypothetical protein JKY09_07205 [Crocinitomicaceae bacterium]|nr:hypothetical protein [Crocinitomicaceae bacterium]